MPKREVILNGGFENNTTTGAGSATTDNWSGNDLEINPLSAFFSGASSADRVVELDGNTGQISTVEQTFSIVDQESAAELSFDMGIRNNSAGDVGVDGGLVEILDDGGAVIFSVTVLPTAFGTFQTFTFDIDFPSAGDYTLRFTEVGDNDSLGAVLNDVSLLICFCTGAAIETPEGAVPVDQLRAGDLVLTKDHGAQPIKWVGKRRVEQQDFASDPALRPILIRASAFGHGAPYKEMRVSPQHRILIASIDAELTFGAPELLAPAKAMIDGVNVVIDARDAPTDYYHLLFDRHEIIWANGLPTESFYPNDQSIKGVEGEARLEILKLFPDILTQHWRVARPILTVSEAKVLSSVTA